MTLPRILVVICGQPPADIEGKHGNYMRWFTEAIGPAVELVPWDVRERVNEPDLREFDGVVVSGSPASLTHPLPWMENAVELIRQAAETAVPLLGVCFGHQLVGVAFGAPTVSAPDDGEHGTYSIALTEAASQDPLFAGTPEQFSAQLTHYDQVDPEAISFSNGLRVLASSPGCAVQALAAGPHIRSVQWHPEFSPKIMQSYLDKRDGDAQASNSDHATNIFQNWIQHWVVGNAS